MNPTKVITAIKQRAEGWCRGNREPDGHKIGLVIEGGGMRGVCSGGGAVALAHLGFSDLFDEVYATSAGVMNASYFLSCQPELGITVYYDSLATREFVNPLRVWKVLDVDYVFNHVVTVAKPLDVGKILASRSRFFVAVMDKRTSEGIIIDTKKTRTPLLQVLKAATAIPVFYNRTVEVDGRPCMDAGLSISFPIEEAFRNQCTDVLVLLTRPFDYRRGPPSWGSRLLFNLFCAHGNRELNLTYLNREEREAECRRLALGQSPTPTGVNIATICADEPELVDRMTTNRAVLRAAAVRYGRKTMRIFGADAEAWDLAPLTYT